jgi:hypothetical protein
MVVSNQITGYYKQDGTISGIGNCDYISVSLLGEHSKDVNGSPLQMLISIEDLASILEHNWYIGRSGYPIAYIGSRKGTSVYHYLMGSYGPDYPIDHINRNKLDNRRSNLRVCTRQENNYNRSLAKNSKYKYKGIRQEKDGSWTAYCTKDGETNEVEGFIDDVTAAKTYDAIAEALYGKFASKNF